MLALGVRRGLLRACRRAVAPRCSRPTSGRTTAPRRRAMRRACRASAVQVVAHRPTSLSLPSGTTVRIDASATAPTANSRSRPTSTGPAGGMAVRGSAIPSGRIVVAAHVDSFDQGLGRFAELLSVRRGEPIVVARRRSATAVPHRVGASSCPSQRSPLAPTSSPSRGAQVGADHLRRCLRPGQRWLPGQPGRDRRARRIRSAAETASGCRARAAAPCSRDRRVPRSRW